MSEQVQPQNQDQDPNKVQEAQDKNQLPSKDKSHQEWQEAQNLDKSAAQAKMQHDAKIQERVNLQKASIDQGQNQEQQIEVPIKNQDKDLQLPQPFKYEFTEIDKPIISEAQDFQKAQKPIVSHKIYRSVIDHSLADACAWVFTSPTTIQKYFYLHPGLTANDVRIRVMYAGVSRSDSYSARGLWGPVPYPLCPGQEIVGEVIATGNAVKNFKVGDRVLYGPIRYSCGTCLYCMERKTNLCPYTPRFLKQTVGQFWGGFSTHLQQPEGHCFKLPDNVELETAPALVYTGATAYKPLVAYGAKGNRLAVIGIGGVGHMAVQIANKMGIDVDAFCTSFDREKKDRLIQGLGVKSLVHWDVDDITAYQGRYDLVMIAMPGKFNAEQLDVFLKLLKPLGKFIILGVPPLNQKLSLNPLTVIEKSIEILCVNGGGLMDIQDCINFCSKNTIRPLCEFFAFDDFPRALDRMENQHPLFKVMLRVDDFSKKFRR
jgi:uncharacterized zinc-type alcohol dehydrogenase-like protein